MPYGNTSGSGRNYLRHHTLYMSILDVRCYEVRVYYLFASGKAIDARYAV
jgi:hypothetical protein